MSRRQHSTRAPPAGTRGEGIDPELVQERLDEVMQQGYGRVEIIVREGKIHSISSTKTDVMSQ